MHRIVWKFSDLNDLVGKPLHPQIVDGNQGPWGHVIFDDFSDAADPAGKR